MTLLDNLINRGELPEVRVQVEIDNNSVVRLSVAILAVMILAILINKAISKYSK